MDQSTKSGALMAFVLLFLVNLADAAGFGWDTTFEKPTLSEPGPAWTYITPTITETGWVEPDSTAHISSSSATLPTQSPSQNSAQPATDTVASSEYETVPSYAGLAREFIHTTFASSSSFLSPASSSTSMSMPDVSPSAEAGTTSTSAVSVASSTQPTALPTNAPFTSFIYANFTPKTRKCTPRSSRGTSTNTAPGGTQF